MRLVKATYRTVSRNVQVGNGFELALGFIHIQHIYFGNIPMGRGLFFACRIPLERIGQIYIVPRWHLCTAEMIISRWMSGFTSGWT
jgi:hypothetical protein